MAHFTDPPLHDFPDRAHRQLLEHPHNLRELVEQAAPDTAPNLDFDAATLRRRDVPLPDWRRSENDLLFHVPYRRPVARGSRRLLVCVLAEHQSKPDPAAPLRTLLYLVVEWVKQWRAWQKRTGKKGPLRLSPVLPIVFYTGHKKWQKYRALSDLIVLPEELRPYAPPWAPVYYDLARQPLGQLRGAPGDWLRTMAVVHAEGGDAATFEAVFAEAAHGLEPLADRDKMRWHDLMSFLVSWGCYRRPEPEWPRIQNLARVSHDNVALKQEIETMSRVVGQTMTEWTHAKIRQARDEALTEGELRAHRSVLRDQLEHRFGPLPEALVQQIENLDDLARLHAATLQVLRISALDELAL